MRKVTKHILALAASLFIVGCSSKLTPEAALTQLKELPEFQQPFYAPFHTGREVLSGDDHKEADGYIRSHLGKLLDAGLVQCKKTDRNSWRTVIEVSLSEQGVALCDKSRSNNEQCYVQVCRVTPIEVTAIREMTPGEKFEVDYTFCESDTTPFGEHLEFADGRTHKDTRLFEKSGFSWKIID